MKRLFNTYRVFTPDLYSIFFAGIGTVLFCIAGAVLRNVMPAEMTLPFIACSFMFADIILDMFVLQGIFAKSFDFGLLANSTKGYSVLKLAVISDQLRRLLQISIVIFVCGGMAYAGLAEKGFFGSPLEYAGFLMVLILTTYSGNTLVLQVTRKYDNFMEGLLFQSICTLINGVLIIGMAAVFMREEYVSPIPWLIVTGIFAIVLTYVMCERVGIRYKESFGERKSGRFGDDSKQKIIVFLSIAFGVDLLMIPAMFIGYQKGIDLSVFMVAQMMYPACGVVLAKLLSYNEGMLPKFSYVLFLVLGAITMVLSAMAISVPQSVEINGTKMESCYLLSNYVIVVFNIIFLIAICACGKEKRENAGYCFRKPGRSVLFMLLFLVLYLAQVVIQMGIYCVQENDWSVMGEFLTQLTGEDALVAWISLVLNIPLTFIMFFGEEYGWRYYLQPRMQKKFGVALGTILLGIVWGLWHVAADFMYYSTETGPQMLIAQIIACIALGIFFGYAYMKTQNIWVPVVMHLMNNNMALVLSGDVSTNALQGNVIGWEQIPFYIIGYAVMWLFIFTPTMRGKSAEKNDVNTVGKTKEA